MLAMNPRSAVFVLGRWLAASPIRFVARYATSPGKVFSMKG
jgi:hypothetical protein